MNETYLIETIGRRNAFLVILIFKVIRKIWEAWVIGIAFFIFLTLIIVCIIGSGLILFTLIGMVASVSGNEDIGSLLLGAMLTGSLLHVLEWMFIIHPLATRLHEFKLDFERKYPVKEKETA